MKEKNCNFTLKVNGRKVEQINAETLTSEPEGGKKTIIDQSNPLLERATRILANMS